MLEYYDYISPLINNLLAKYKSTIMDGPKVLFQETEFQWNLFNGSYVLPITVYTAEHSAKLLL